MATGDHQIRQPNQPLNDRRRRKTHENIEPEDRHSRNSSRYDNWQRAHRAALEQGAQGQGQKPGGESSKDRIESVQGGETARRGNIQRKNTDIKEDLQHWSGSKNFYDIKSIKNDQNIRNLGEGLNDQKVINDYHQVIRDIDGQWGVIQSLSQRKDGLTSAGDMLNHYLKCQIESISIADKMKKDNASYKGALSENTRSLRNLSNILEASNPPSNVDVPGLREQLKSVQSGTLGKRRDAALKTIKRFWGKIWESPDDGIAIIPTQWNGTYSRPMENTERLLEDINNVRVNSSRLRAAKNWACGTGQEAKQILRSDVYKAVLFLEATANRLQSDFSSNQPPEYSSVGVVIPQA